MGGTKIFVFKMKTIVTAAAAVVIGLALIVAAITLIAGRGAKQGGAAYRPGTYSSYIILHNRPVAVEVTLSKTEIVAIELADLDAAQELAYPLFRPVMAQISDEVLRKQSTDMALAVDTQVTSRILLDAVDVAIKQGLKN